VDSVQGTCVTPGRCRCTLQTAVVWVDHQTGEGLVRKVTEGLISDHRFSLSVTVLSCYCQSTVAITVTTTTTVTSVDITAISVTAVITTETLLSFLGSSLLTLLILTLLSAVRDGPTPRFL
jgi:hypothetical protein